MSELTEVPLQPSQTSWPPRGAQGEIDSNDFPGANLSRRLLHRVRVGGKNLVVVANAVVQQGPHAAE